MLSAVFYIALILFATAVALMIMSPAAGFLAAVFAKPWVDATYDVPFLFGLPMTQVISAAVPVLAFTSMLVRGRNDRALNRMPFYQLWIAWICYAALFSTIIAVDAEPKAGAEIFFRHANGIAGFYAVQAWLRSEDGAKAFVFTLILAGLFPIATGVYEGITGSHWRMVLGEGDLLRNVGLYHDAIAIRVYALQTILALVLASVLYMPRSLTWRAFAAVYAAACLFVIYHALSKSGTLVILAWALLWPALRRTKFSLPILAVVVALTALYVSSEWFATTAWVFQKEIAAVGGHGDVSHTFAGRWAIWEEWPTMWQGFSVWQQLFGSGMNAMGLHNDYLMILTHGGLIGFSIYVVLLGSIVVTALRNVAARPSVWNVAACLVLVMWIVDSIGLVPSGFSAYQWFAWGVVGLALRLDRDRGIGWRPAHVSPTPTSCEVRFSILR
jgi:hypothetical protein